MAEMAMSRLSMNDVTKRALAMRNAALDHVAKLESPLRKAAWDGLALGSLFAFTFMNGRYANPKAGGMVGYDFIAGFIFYAGSVVTQFVGTGSRVVQVAGHAAHAIGFGGVASYIAKLGAGVGLDARTKALAAAPAAPGGSKTSGYTGRYHDLHRGSRVAGALSPEEAAHYVAGHR